MEKGRKEERERRRKEGKKGGILLKVNVKGEI